MNGLSWQTVAKRATGARAVALAAYHEGEWTPVRGKVTILWSSQRRGPPQVLALGDVVLLAKEGKLVAGFLVDAVAKASSDGSEVTFTGGYDRAERLRVATVEALKTTGRAYGVGLLLKPWTLDLGLVEGLVVTKSPSGWHLL